jgi:hypothetical protein
MTLCVNKVQDNALLRFCVEFLEESSTSLHHLNADERQRLPSDIPIRFYEAPGAQRTCCIRTISFILGV